MLEQLNNIIIMIADPFLTWLLYLPLDWVVAIVAIGTSAILTFSRLISTDQNMLGRCDKDKKRIAELMKEAKKAGDKEAVTRYQSTTAVIAMKLMRSEGKPLLVSILPIALLGCWCMARIAFIPPADLEQVKLVAYFPASELGEVVHLMPEEGVRASKWIARVIDAPDVVPGQEGMAEWKIKGKERKEEPYSLKMMCKGQVHEMDFLVGSKKYSPNIKFFNGDNDVMTVAEVQLKPYWFMGKLHLPWFGLDYFIFPWLLAYLLIAVPFVFILKGMFDIH